MKGIIAGANFSNTFSRGFTPSQFNSTASYKSGDLAGIDFSSNTFSYTDWNFSGKSLVNAKFTSASFSNVNFRNADLRGAINWSNAWNATNAIYPDGSLNGLHLYANEKLIIRNYPMAITAKTAAIFDPLSTLQIQLDANWGSKMQFDAGVTPTLAGTLDLEITPGIDPYALEGQSFQLFAWNAPLDPANHFTTITTDPRATFDLSNLYTTGVVTITDVGTGDIPEPASGLLLLAGSLLLCRRPSRRRKFRTTVL